MDIGYKLKILSKNLETHLTQKLKKDGITSAQFHILVYLTGKGWQCTVALEENRIYVNEQLLSGFSDADKVELHRLLLKLEKNIAALK